MKTKKMHLAWTGEKARPIKVYRPCDCATCKRDNKNQIGFLSGSDGNGVGFTIWLESEEVFQAVATVLGSGAGSPN